MLKNQRILITGDDGYNSIGIRVLIKLLREDNALKIMGTATQQSGVGGLLNLKSSAAYEKSEVDGIEAVSIVGSPVDAIEHTRAFFPQKFDLVISGINMGENVAYSVISSGTFAAAVRAIGCDLAPHAIVFSSKVDPSNFFHNHNGVDPIADYLDYPGEAVLSSIDTILENDFWGKRIVNVNFPAQKTDQFKITKLDDNLINYWDRSLTIDPVNKTISQDNSHPYSKNMNMDVRYDTGALNNGFISINPVTFE